MQKKSFFSVSRSPLLRTTRYEVRKSHQSPGEGPKDGGMGVDTSCQPSSSSSSSVRRTTAPNLDLLVGLSDLCLK